MSCSSIHFIHTISGGLVWKIPSVDTCGRPVFKFKEIGAIYDSECANKIKMPSSVGVRVTRSNSRKRDLNEGGFSDKISSGCVNGVDIKSDNDEFSICELTLKELKDRCKAKKRKVPKFVDSEKQGIDLSRKWDSTCIQIKEEDDLEETLSCWKSKLPKRFKVKTKYKGKQSCSPGFSGSVSFQDNKEGSSSSYVACDSMHGAIASVQAIHEHSRTGELCILDEIKGEISERDCSTFASVLKVNLSNSSSTELLEGADGSEMDTGEPSHFIKKIYSEESTAELPRKIGVDLEKRGSDLFTSKSQLHCSDESSTEFLKPGEPSNILGGMSKMGFADNQESPYSFTSELNMVNDLTQQPPISTPKDLGSEFSRSCYNHFNPKEILSQMHPDTVTEMHNLAMDSLRCSKRDYGRCVSDMESENLGKLVADVPVKCEISVESSKGEASDNVDLSHSLHCLSPDSQEKHESCSHCIPLREMSHMNDYMVAEQPDMGINHNVQFTGLDKGNDASPSDLESRGLGELAEISIDQPMHVDSVENTIPGHENHFTTERNSVYAPSQNSNLFFTDTNNFDSFASSSPIDQVTAMPSTTVDETGECNELFDSCSKNEPASMESLREVLVPKLKCFPEKLLSTRKAISPISQEKLRRAAELEEICDNRRLSKHRSLCVEKWNKSKISTEGSCFKEVEFTIKKQRNRTSGSPSLMSDVVKPQHGRNNGSLIDENAHKAITFSERQMHDIESLAMKLVNGLKLIKSIVEDTLLSEACLSITSKYTVDEIREAANNSMELEENTNKWLLMMRRDCNRFCKIMASKKSKVTKYKKVTFADEIGGVLCHVKVLEGSPTSLTIIEGEETNGVRDDEEI